MPKTPNIELFHVEELCSRIEEDYDVNLFALHPSSYVRSDSAASKRLVAAEELDKLLRANRRAIYFIESIGYGKTPIGIYAFNKHNGTELIAESTSIIKELNDLIERIDNIEHGMENCSLFEGGDDE